MEEGREQDNEKYYIYLTYNKRCNCCKVPKFAMKNRNVTKLEKNTDL